MSGFFAVSQVKSDKVRIPTLPRCGSCGLAKSCTSPKLQPTGPSTSRILFVSGSPSSSDDELGRTFSSESDRAMKHYLRDKHGFELHHDARAMYSLICHASKKQYNAKKLAACRPNVFNEIKRLKPNLIILLGSRAVSSVLGPYWKTEAVGEVDKWCGWQIPLQPLNAWVCPTWHPANVTHAEQARECKLTPLEFHSNLSAALELEHSRPWTTVPNWKKEVRLVYSEWEAAKILRKMRQYGGRIAWDIETNALKPDDDRCKIICASVCWEGRRTIAFPWSGEAVNALGELLADPTIKKIGANLKFEDRWMKAKLDFDVQGWYWDTVQAAHNLDPRNGVTSVKFQSLVRLGFPDYTAGIEQHLKSADKHGLNSIDQIAIEDLLLYCGLDSLLEYKLYEAQERDLA